MKSTPPEKRVRLLELFRHYHHSESPPSMAEENIVCLDWRNNGKLNQLLQLTVGGYGFINVFGISANPAPTEIYRWGGISERNLCLMKDMKDSDVIDEFVAHLRKNGHPGLKVDRCPDNENRNSPDIDAIAGPFAIEHTSVDTLPNQRRNNDWFMQVIDGLEQELSSQLSFRLKVTLEYGVVTKKQDWKAIREALKSWIINEAPCLVDGDHVLNDVHGIPFKLDVKKEKETDFPLRLAFYRFTPHDNTLPNRIKKQSDRKAKKLAKYQGLGKTTVLLIESYDIALMNPGIMLTGIRKAYPNGPPSVVDKIWYADTSIPDCIRFTDFTSDL